MHESRTANLLGATALAVTDLTLAGVTASVGLGGSGAAALVVLSASGELPGTELGRRVGLSQSAAARMIDSLESGGLVRRHSGAGRAVPVELTPAGRQAARDLLGARQAPLTEALGALDAEEQRVLAGLLAKLLPVLYGEVGSAELVCRLCDRDSCVRDAVCPVGQAAREREG